MFKELRIQIFNWFAAGKLTLTYEKPQEYKMSTYTIAGSGAGQGGITLGPSTQGPITGQTLTLKLTPANGGHIVSISSGAGYGSEESLYIITDEADFDRELGKIITMNKLKS